MGRLDISSASYSLLRAIVDVLADRTDLRLELNRGSEDVLIDYQ
jgi:hypothetical protein